MVGRTEGELLTSIAYDREQWRLSANAIAHRVRENNDKLSVGLW